MDDTNEELSKRLHDVLDLIGASEYNRNQYWDSAMITGIITHFTRITFPIPDNSLTFYEVGSQCEGTTTPGLASDVDGLTCTNAFPVVENLLNSKQRGTSLLMLTDEDTKPGYCRLQIVQDKCPVIDKNGRVCATNSKLYDRDTHKISRNGPANTISGNGRGPEIDEVKAFRCQQIPRSANSWLHRIRKYDWPSQKQLRTISSYGCFFVGVGHPHSKNKSFEWRISFTLQERDLMSSLNKTQHKCYILLKMIKKDLIEPNAGESISSYHCKTSLFYTIENSHPLFWTNAKLILCVQQCLKRLFIWVKARNCPNYFIPEENMFDKLSVKTLEKIEYVLNDILKKDIKFLYSLTCDDVGELLKSKLNANELLCNLVTTNSSFIPNYHICNRIPQLMFILRNQFISFIDTITFTGYMYGLMQLLLYLQNTNHVLEHTTQDVRMALDSITPHIQLQYKQCTYAQYVSQGNWPDLQTMTVTNIIPEISEEVDLFSSKLSLASLYIQSEQYQEACKRILVSCEQNICSFVVSVCVCNQRNCYINLDLNKLVCCIPLSRKEFRQYTTGCMVFHPSQASLVHSALQYEMFRNVYTQPESENIHDHWLNGITVDSQIYLYFLQYVLYSNETNLAYKIIAVNKLLTVLKKDLFLGHRETALNLLGWIFIQKNELQQAWSYLCSSWKERPFINAAKWHMLILLSEKISRT